MGLTAGSRLGPYEILAPLGAGGMGEVYRARDTRLGREVAIKLLPETLASDPERLLRFEQEARSASALNHPNIVTIYEVGKTDSISYISMELVQGRTLRDLLSEGAIPPKRLLALAVQIADALGKAHDAGIVHRDLKPENLMVTRDGFVKILDFGLAKLAGTTGAEMSQIETAIQTTRPGVVLGTAGYMSPEQASGKPVDFRSDQFSLGSILYEMATGKRAFSRGTTAETLAAIIRDEPEPLPSLAPQVPTTLRWVIERCLAKDPEDRYASTRDLARDLAHMRDHVSEVSSAATPVVSPRRLKVPVAVLAAGWVVAAGLAIFAILRTRPQPAAGAVHFSIAIPPGTIYSPAEISRGFSVSPDGTRLVIEAFSRGHRRLFVRPLESEKAVELEGSADAIGHFWSPDSRFIAFFAGRRLEKIPAAGGPPDDLSDASFPVVGSWNREGTILFTRTLPGPLSRISDKGGEAVPVTSLDLSRHESTHMWPQFLTDGKRFLFVTTLQTGPGAKELEVGSLDSKERRAVARLESRAEYVPPGYLLFVREGSLFAQRFDERGAKLSGEPRLLAENVHYFFGPALASFSASQTGVLAYQAATPLSRLVWLDRSGKEIGELGRPSVVNGFRIFTQGDRVAAAVEDRRTGTSDVWVFETGRNVSTRLHFDPVDEKNPVWSSDGTKVFYRSDRKGPPDIYEIAVGVPGSERPVVGAPGVQQPEDVSADGRFLVFLNGVATMGADIWLLPLEKNGKPFAWLETRFNESSPRFSPDGGWIAYDSDESGETEVYAALTEGAAAKRRLSPAGGRLPRWRRDGKELYYVAPGGVVMSVPISPGPRLDTGVPVQLFRVEPEVEDYDVTPDGTRFLVSMPVEKARESPLRVIVNWPAALKSER